MILWINGAFGCGKSSVAAEINKSVNKSFVYDPEQVGYFLWDNFPEEMKAKGNFQHLPIWREFNYKILKHIADNYEGIIIVPMTVYVKQYYDEIVESLMSDGIAVNHFILSATKQTIIERLVKRGEAEDCWAAKHVDVCLAAFETDISERKINAEIKNANEIACEIIALLGLPA